MISRDCGGFCIDVGLDCIPVLYAYGLWESQGHLVLEEGSRVDDSVPLAVLIFPRDFGAGDVFREPPGSQL